MKQLTNRRINLIQATALNMIDMVGIGPFVVIPLVIRYFDSSLFLWAWIFGAFVAFMDSMIWSELGAAFPLAGGSYNFLRESYGAKWGRMMSFLFVWQTSIQAPLVLASGAIGFAQYVQYLVPLEFYQQKIVSAGIIVLLAIMLYRRIETIGKISVLLWIGVILTIIWIIWGGFTHRTISFSFMPDDTSDFFKAAFWVALGQASVKTIYSYLGYYNVCHLGGEIKNPEKNIPRSIFISIVCISVLYISMNISIAGVIPWQEAQQYDFIVSIFIEKIYGVRAAQIATGLVLWIAFASLFAVLLGYSRVPYAAALDGNFFKVFSKVHPTKAFPHISLLYIAGLGLLFSLFFNLREVISAILAMRILVQFVAQGIGVILLRKEKRLIKLPFRMWWYPVPVILSITVWLFVFFSTGWFALWGVLLAAAGCAVYFIKSKYEHADLIEKE